MRASGFRDAALLLRLLGDYRLRYLVGVVLYSLAAASMPIILAFVFKLLIDALVNESGSLQSPVLLLASSFVMLAAASSLCGYLFQTAVKRAMSKLRTQLFETMCAARAERIGQIHSGTAASLYTGDVPIMERAYTEAIQTTLQLSFLGLGSIAAMLALDWRFPAGLLIITAISVWLGSRFMRQLRLAGRRQQNMLARFAEHYADAKEGLSVIQMFGMQPRVTRRFQSIAGRLNDTSVRIGTSTARLEAVEYMMDIVGFGGVVVLGGFLYSYGLAEFGTVVAIVQLQMGFIGIFSGISAPLALLQQSFAAAGRVKRWLDMPKETDCAVQWDETAAGAPAEAAAAAISEWGGGEASFVPVVGMDSMGEAAHTASITEPLALEWSGVHAGYGERQTILNGVTLQVEAGSLCAVVGWSGCGKSTLLRTLLGFVKPAAGVIRIGGRDIREMEPDELRRLIAYVPQEPLLFAGTIADNIRHGRPDATDEQVELAAEAAGAKSFIDRLPGRYSFEIGERGHLLSGGERQRISIARAIIKEAPVMLLDEPTSSLDGEIERAVTAAVEALRGQRTILVVAHRLATIIEADQIAVMHDGSVVEQGTHAELLQLGGWYEALYESQTYPAVTKTGA
ncbi:ABC transporter ATP-binding protein [Paenibacillus xylaniclasticus]|uniref:ABC transporter ATP-binding protein n=1 Tax=Paenibacillus xylaniclasticus TaxID=588083 RepID=UPI0013E09DEC|nr:MULTISPECIES: ABC transporter ATP-binding protein [Paenibacillus]GFN29931.1 ABC transporter [Paenibacillus curdlanolyticus]